MSGRRAAAAALVLLAVSLLGPSYAQDGAKLCTNGGTCLDGIATACSCAGSDTEFCSSDCRSSWGSAESFGARPLPQFLHTQPALYLPGLQVPELCVPCCN